ncbi:hypothetical protein AAEY27_13090 [Kosakonia sp. BYX6]|uniref:Uncharacterized protein n=1 Tax=Kosakonia calanthes TaxID=3139408 RepID=A0ABZ3B603_9ENTR
MEHEMKIEFSGGITYREWLAGQALQGLLASDGENKFSVKDSVSTAIAYADEVIRQLRSDNNSQQ